MKLLKKKLKKKNWKKKIEKKIKFEKKKNHIVTTTLSQLHCHNFIVTTSLSQSHYDNHIMTIPSSHFENKKKFENKNLKKKVEFLES